MIIGLKKIILIIFILNLIECNFDTLHPLHTLVLYYTLTNNDKNHDLYQNKLDTFHNSFF